MTLKHKNDTLLHFQISEATLNNWVKNHIPEAKQEGGFDIEVIQSYINKKDKLSKRANKKLNKTIESNSQLLNYLDDVEWIPEWISLIQELPIEKTHFLEVANYRSFFHAFHTDIARLIHELIPDDVFSLGVAYQYFLASGEKSNTGAYYTPKFLVESIVSNVLGENKSFLEPCSGVGFFAIIYASNHFQRYNSYPFIHINDLDEVALSICLNALLRLGVPNDHIYSTNENGLQMEIENTYDVIATNPPYGIKNHYGEMKTTEIFSHFIHKCFHSYLSQEGHMTMVLPSSLLAVGKHAEIRKDILSHMAVNHISFEGKCFDNVFSDIIVLAIEKKAPQDTFSFFKKGEVKEVPQSYCLNSHQHIINFVGEKDIQEQEAWYQKPHETLENATFGLGIVTGDNKTFLSDTQLPGYIPVIDGKSVSASGVLIERLKWLKNEPDRFQQKPPLNLFGKKKIVYKFISNRIVACVDDKGYYTLNSANFFILPEDFPFSEEYVCEILNSDIVNNIFQVKFGYPIKVLKSHLQSLPIFYNA